MKLKKKFHRIQLILMLKFFCQSCDCFELISLYFFLSYLYFFPFIYE